MNKQELIDLIEATKEKLAAQGMYQDDRLLEKLRKLEALLKAYQ